MIIDSKELIGQSLGTCKLQHLVGRGGMGAVYLAQQTRPHRIVAVKVLMPGVVLESKTNIEFLARFRREADAVAALDHINILPIYEYGEQGDTAYLVMPYVTGGTLRDHLEKRRILSLDEIIPILEQAAAALDCAHAKGIVHRDLKPGNILFHADGRVLLADFGLAKVLKDVTDEGRTSASAGALTSAGMIIGTPEYLSPEQGMGHTIDYHSDIYSLGVMLYQMLIGKVPFSGASPVAIAIKHAMEEPPAITELNPNIPHSVETVVKIAMAKQPERRFASAGALAKAFKDAVIGTETMPSVSSIPTPLPASPSQKGNQDSAAVQEVPVTPLHESPTEEALAPATPIAQPAKPAIESASTIVELPNVSKPVTQATQEPKQQVKMRSKTLAQTASNPIGKRRRSIRPFLIAGLLALVLISGGLLSYMRMPQSKAGLLHDTSQSTPLPDQTHIATQAATFTPFAYGLSSDVQPAGKSLYATNYPGSCDTRGGHWDTQGNIITVSCASDGAELRNSGPTHLAGAFLNTLPSKQAIPNNYILQVRMTINHNSLGEFGVFFRNQPTSQATFSFMMNVPKLWKVYSYSPSGPAVTMAQGPIFFSITQSVTLDVVVQDDHFTFYLDGTQVGAAISGLYTSGTVGLALDSYADISFKDFALYALP